MIVVPTLESTRNQHVKHLYQKLEITRNWKWLEIIWEGKEESQRSSAWLAGIKWFCHDKIDGPSLIFYMWPIATPRSRFEFVCFTKLYSIRKHELVGGLEHFLFFHILGMSSSQLTNSYFSEGQVYHQPDESSVVPPCFTLTPIQQQLGLEKTLSR